jgi:hypothetical protein
MPVNHRIYYIPANAGEGSQIVDNYFPPDDSKKDFHNPAKKIKIERK